MVVKTVANGDGGGHYQVGREALESLAMTKLQELLKDRDYLALNRDTGTFEKTPVTPEFLRAIVRSPYIGFVFENDIDKYLYAMTDATLIKFLNKIRESKPEGSTTERTAMVFDILNRYEACVKGDERLLENNKFNKNFVDSNAFKDVWNDIISVSQMLTMSSLKDMVAFMTENGDLDEQTVRSGLLRRN